MQRISVRERASAFEACVCTVCKQGTHNVVDVGDVQVVGAAAAVRVDEPVRVVRLDPLDDLGHAREDAIAVAFVENSVSFRVRVRRWRQITG